MKKILIVDDEAQILKSLSRMFLDTDYEILTSQSGEDALKRLESADIDLIISDMRMPVLDGYKLLRIVKEKYPKIIRIILSGYADEKPMFQALLHNVAMLYVFKPWKNDEFLQKINKLFSDENVLESPGLINKVNGLGNITETLKSCDKMNALIEEENLDALVEEIEKDADISNLLIQVAKSAVYGVMPDKVKQAAIYMGLPNLKCFIRFVCVARLLNPDHTIPEEPALLSKHAYYTNRIFLFLFEAFLHKQPQESAMFAGLLHNTGLFILSESLQQNSGKETPLSLEEYHQLDTSDQETAHQEIGAYFLNQWDLPFPMYEAALYHHRPLNPNIINQELVSCVHIAQAYAWKALGVAEPEAVAPEVFENIGIAQEDFEKRLGRYMK